MKETYNTKKNKIKEDRDIIIMMLDTWNVTS